MDEKRELFPQRPSEINTPTSMKHSLYIELITTTLKGDFLHKKKSLQGTHVELTSPSSTES